MPSTSIPNWLPHEVLTEICLSVLHPYPSRGLHTLASLARTSRLFHNSAVNAIWREIPNITVLIRTLPEDLWLETRIKNIRNDLIFPFRTRLTLKRPPVQSDFARLKHYAHRVERILHSNSCSIPHGVLNALATHFPAGTFLPNIRSLTHHYLVPPPSERDHSLQLLFGPKLKGIHVIGAAAGPVGTQLSSNAESFDCLRALTHICPQLLAITICLEPVPSHQSISAIPEIITAFDHLTHLRASDVLLDFPAIRHLASLQSLETLDTGLSDNIAQADLLSLTSTLSSRQAGYFPSLMRVSLNHRRSLSLFTSLLKLISSPSLDEAILSIPKASDATCTSEDVSELLLELSHHTSLTCIMIFVYSSSPVTGPRFDSTTFAPLLALRNMCVLDIDITHPADICNELIVSMASTWPSLSRLSIGVAHPRAHPLDVTAFLSARSPTLFGLASFALFCPQLDSLGLPLDTNLWCDPYAFDRLERRPGCGAVLSRMNMLDVGLSFVHDPVAVAAILSDVFPDLCRVGTAWGHVKEEEMPENLHALGRPSDIKAKWTQVADLVDDFAAVRAQERREKFKTG